MNKLEITQHIWGEVELYYSNGGTVIRWVAGLGELRTPRENRYAHLYGKKCTEAQALLILNQIKRELENE